MNNKTYKDLKDFLETLSEDQLKQDVVIDVVDYSTYRNVSFGVVKEDIYMRDNDGDDIGTLAELKEIYGDEYKEEDCELITAKGSVFISVDN